METNAQNQQQGNEGIDFKWDEVDSTQSQDFFGTGKSEGKSEAQRIGEGEVEIEEAEEKEIKKKKDKEPKKPEGKEKETEEEKEEPANLSFDDDNEDDDDENEENGKTKNPFSEIIKAGKEEGIFTIDIPEDIDELDRETVAELLEREVEERKDKEIQDMFQGLDETGVKYLKFLREGGKTEDFVDTFVNVIPDNLDTKAEEVQIEIVKFYLEQQEESASDIQDRINYLKENNKLESTANGYYEKLKVRQEKEKEKLLAKQTKAAEEEKKNRDKFSKKLSSVLEGVKEIKGMPITEKDKRRIHNLITKPSTENTRLTGLQVKLNEVFKSEEKLILLGKILDSDFNFEELIKKGESKATKKIQGKIKEDKQGGKSLKGVGSQRKQTNLWDALPENFFTR